jgi:lipopolysaccharide transport system permease protein
MWRHRGLLAELVKREFSGRYRGSFGGVAWSLAQPLFLLAVYTVAFGVILKARWGGQGGTADYALMLFAGLIVFNTFAECLTRAPTLVASNPNFVKKVVFPLELMPWVMVLAALAHAAIAVAVWVAAYAALFGMPRATALFFPAIFACFAPVLLGLGWLLSALGVLVRDIAQVTSLIAHALLFLTPIFYTVDAAPAAIRPLLLANPLTFIVEALRHVLFDGTLPSLPALALYFVLACVFAWLCLALFRRMRPAFADLV